MDRHDGQYHAVFREMAPVADDHIADVADAFAVDEDAPDLNRLDLLRPSGGQFKDVAVIEQKAMFLRDADLLGEPAVAHQMAIFTMDRHEIARPRELQHGLQ